VLGADRLNGTQAHVTTAYVVNARAQQIPAARSGLLRERKDMNLIAHRKAFDECE
jgi:hypothetical protein